MVTFPYQKGERPEKQAPFWNLKSVEIEMIVAEQAVNVINPKVVIPAAPKQTKLLGAVVEGVGTITSVSAYLADCFALVERADGTEAHVFVADLTRDLLTFPSEPQPYHAVTRRIGFGLWADMIELESVQFTDLTHVDEIERAA